MIVLPKLAGAIVAGGLLLATDIQTASGLSPAFQGTMAIPAAVPPAAMPPASPAAPPGNSPSRPAPAATSAVQAPSLPAPPNQTLVTLPKLGNREIRDVLEALRFRLEASHGYEAVEQTAVPNLGSPPGGVAEIRVLRKKDGDQWRILRFGVARMPSQMPQFWSQGLMTGAQRATPGNPDAEMINAMLDEVLKSLDQSNANINLSELEARVVKLSYIDADSALYMLGSMGFFIVGESTPDQVNDPSAATAQVSPTSGFPAAFGSSSYSPSPFASSLYPGSVPAKPPIPKMPRSLSNTNLPMVVKIPGPDPQSAGLVGEVAGAVRDSMGLSVGPGASRLAAETISSPMSQLMIMFNPSQPEQFSRVRHAIEEVIDKPARQIYVEGMVLEVAYDELQSLGIQWEIQNGFNKTVLGKLIDGGKTRSLDFSRDPTASYSKDFWVKVNALIQRGKAEVLSRPSVLTLDNRQATIRVGTDIPIATSKDASSAAEARVSFSFTYLPTGIILSVRPRVEAQGREVSMLIDTTVSSTVPNKDLELRSAEGAVLASAPTISNRRVQTYARIANNTPLIIGGLISRDSTSNTDKVPVLGDIPLLGKLFRAETSSVAKNEVIIVLTPYVLTEGQSIAKAFPQDKDEFDSFGYALFRDAYRLRAEDVFDTRFIRTNYRYNAYRKVVKRLASADVSQTERTPLAKINHDRVPGEDVLINGMMFALTKRLNLGDGISSNRIVVTEGKRGDEIKLRPLVELLSRYGDGQTPDSFFGKNPGKALAITLYNYRNPGKTDYIMAETAADIRLVDCPDRNAWARLLWEYNAPGRGGLESYTILIQSPDDIERLAKAIYVKRLLSVNGGESNSLIANYLVGRTISLPDIKPTQDHLLDSATARYFFHSHDFARAFAEEYENTLDAIDAALRKPEMRYLLDEGELPGGLSGKTDKKELMDSLKPGN